MYFNVEIMNSEMKRLILMKRHDRQDIWNTFGQCTQYELDMVMKQLKAPRQMELHTARKELLNRIKRKYGLFEG